MSEVNTSFIYETADLDPDLSQVVRDYNGELRVHDINMLLTFFARASFRPKELILGKSEKEFLAGCLAGHSDGVSYVKSMCRKQKIKIVWSDQKSIVAFR